MNELNTAAKQRKLFADRAPYLYRIAVIRCFKLKYLEFRKQEGHPFNSIKGLVKEFSSYGKLHPDELKGRFSKKLDNIIKLDTACDRVEDQQHFEFIEEFMWRHFPEDISDLDIFNELRFFTKSFKSFTRPILEKAAIYNENTEVGKTTKKVQPVPLTNLRSIDSGFIYKFSYCSPTAENDNYSLLSRTEHSYEITSHYLVIKNSKYSENPIALIFSDSENISFCYGSYLPYRNILLLKKADNHQPIIIECSECKSDWFTMDDWRQGLTAFDIRSCVYISPLGIWDYFFLENIGKYHIRDLTYSHVVTFQKGLDYDFAIKRSEYILNILRT